MTTTENQIERDLISKLEDLKYTYRPDIRDRAALEHNFRKHFEALNRVQLTDSEFARLLDSIVTPDVFAEPSTYVRKIASSVMMVRHSITRWSTSRTGARTTSRWSISCASALTTAITVMT